MAGRSAAPGVPPLPPEDHRCAECGFDYATAGVQQAVSTIRELPGAVRAVVEPVPRQALRQRPREGTWSVTEYLCHLRDVYVTYTIRLHRARTEERPVLEPMLNDLRARRFRYNSRDVHPVLDELTDAVTGFSDEVARVQVAGWDRVVTRLPGEERTARWLVRQAAHEGVHHLRDLRAVARVVAP
jgi:DinB family protein